MLFALRWIWIRLWSDMFLNFLCLSAFHIIFSLCRDVKVVCLLTMLFKENTYIPKKKRKKTKNKKRKRQNITEKKKKKGHAFSYVEPCETHFTQIVSFWTKNTIFICTAWKAQAHLGVFSCAYKESWRQGRKELNAAQRSLTITAAWQQLMSDRTWKAGAAGVVGCRVACRGTAWHATAA